MSRKTIINVFILIFIVVIFVITAFLVDFNMIAVGKVPMFSITKNSYNDGGTKEYLGLFYKIFDYKIIDGKNKIEFGTWFMSYDKD